MNGENGKKFEGYVTAKLEGICDSIDEFRDEIKRLNTRVTNMQVKMAGIGAVVSLIVTLVLFLIREVAAKP